MSLYKGYEAVIGLEVHVELKTETKIFCSCKTKAKEPNTAVCPVCMGMPGALPVLNKKAFEYALKAALALECEINECSSFDRKNYFYPDLPKGYQITQFYHPLATGGKVRINTENGEKNIGIKQIHLEEDAGKLVHDGNEFTLIDNNRAGVPLIEIVSNPEISSAKEALSYLKNLKNILVCTGVSDCRMNEGELRCDVNISVHKPGEKNGTRTEIKNLNSFQFAAKAIEYEYKRQADLLENGEEVVMETRRFDEAGGKTLPMRSKEQANDYRYFPEPNLPCICVDKDAIERIRKSLPELPDKRKKRYVDVFGLSEYESECMVSDCETAEYFEKCASMSKYPKIAANLIIGEILKLKADGNGEIPVCPSALAEVCDLSGDDKINSPTAKKLVKLLAGETFDVESYVIKNNLLQINDKDIILNAARNALLKNPKAKNDYLGGKQNALKVVVGAIMAETNGRANPVIANEAAKSVLEE